MSPESAPAWNAAHRIAFRFLFAYCALYTLQLVRPGLVTWAGSQVFGKTIRPPTSMGGSGDTSFHWVQLFCVFALAVLAAAVWSAFDRARPHYRTLHRWLRAWLRYGLGTALIGYGMAKIIQTQFPYPSADRLAQPIGESSPMGLLWTFMGFSAGYNLFAGLAEAIPGVLLFFRRTALLGALLGAAAMANVVALNFFYDVPVKIFSTHLLLFAGMVAAPDFRRLAGVFLSNEPTPPADLRPAFNAPRVVRVWQFAKAALLIAMIGVSVKRGLGRQAELEAGIHGDPYGVYAVQEPRTVWAEVVFGRAYSGEGMARVREAGGDVRRFGYSIDEKSVTFRSPQGAYRLEMRKPEPGLLELGGTIDGKPVAMKLRKRTGGMLLETRGFHWVNEFPFNR